MDLVSEILPVVIRELVASKLLDHKTYWTLQQVSHDIRDLVNYILPPLRAKHRFTYVAIDNSNENFERCICVLPNNERNGIEIALSKLRVNYYFAFYVSDIEVYSYTTSDIKGEFNFAKGGGTHHEIRSYIDISCSYDYVDDDSPNKQLVNHVDIHNGEYSIVRSDYICDSFALECSIDRENRISCTEIPKCYGYYLMIHTDKFNACLWYYESQFYSIYKSEEFKNQITNISNMTSESGIEDAFMKLSKSFGWKYIEEETIFKVALDE